ncbi:response regulator transcription factor [Microcoleus sp. Pol11C1]|uniref:response regulator transcription factor n=1 Tax=unclassified Microcoleus TaxID=2642155 RepID=UPI002FD6C677
MSHNSTQEQQLEILIVDDHRLLLNGTISLVGDRFPRAKIRSCQTVQDALTEVRKHLPDLAIVDLSLPEISGTAANVEQGLGLLKVLMQDYRQLNLMVQSSNVKALVRIIPEIDNHQGGFTIADKSVPIDTFLTRMEWAMQGLTHTKDLQTDLEVKPEWLEVMRLAFEEGLQDKAIAQTMHKSERMIRHYWSKIQDALSIYPEEGKNMRAQTQIRARKIGLID